ncbi:MAG: hypothetical protein LC749_08605, partial [Actinobacteria bacterium]|nr:hypothetical protein [Actinomycetota bacterium]
MRMMMRVQIPVEAGNGAIAEGKLPGIIKEAMEKLKPEAAYFMADDGVRTALFFFDLPDSSHIPVFAEPFFQGVDAMVGFRPVMNAEEL